MTEQAVREQPSLEPLKGQKLTVIAWLWARTVASPNPAANGAHVPLVSSFMLSTKEGEKAWVEPVIDASAPDGYRFVVRSGRIAKEDEAKAKAGTKAGRGANFTCALTDTPLTSTHINAPEQPQNPGDGRDGGGDGLSEGLLGRARELDEIDRDARNLGIDALHRVDEARKCFVVLEVLHGKGLHPRATVGGHEAPHQMCGEVLSSHP